MAEMPTTSPAAAMSRILWIAIGPMLLAATIASIVLTGGGWLTIADVGYFLILGLMIVARWYEFQSGTPLTSTGEPATQAHLQRYVVGTIVLGLLGWVLANLAGNHLW